MLVLNVHSFKILWPRIYVNGILITVFILCGENELSSLMAVSHCGYWLLIIMCTFSCGRE